jgi:hypothetical protein
MLPSPRVASRARWKERPASWPAGSATELGQRGRRELRQSPLPDTSDPASPRTLTSRLGSSHDGGRRPEDDPPPDLTTRNSRQPVGRQGKLPADESDANETPARNAPTPVGMNRILRAAPGRSHSVVVSHWIASAALPKATPLLVPRVDAVMRRIASPRGADHLSDVAERQATERS